MKKMRLIRKRLLIIAALISGLGILFAINQGYLRFPPIIVQNWLGEAYQRRWGREMDPRYRRMFAEYSPLVNGLIEADTASEDARFLTAFNRFMGNFRFSPMWLSKDYSLPSILDTVVHEAVHMHQIAGPGLNRIYLGDGCVWTFPDPAAMPLIVLDPVAVETIGSDTYDVYLRDRRPGNDPMSLPVLLDEYHAYYFSLQTILDLCALVEAPVHPDVDDMIVQKRRIISDLAIFGDFELIIPAWLLAARDQEPEYYREVMAIADFHRAFLAIRALTASLRAQADTAVRRIEALIVDSGRRPENLSWDDPARVAARAALLASPRYAEMLALIEAAASSAGAPPAAAD
jgi:hypothetical protein